MATSANAVIPFDAAKLQLALRNITTATPPSMSFLRMDKTGAWSYGADSSELDGDEFALNPASFQWGYVAWADTSNGAPANKLDERMGPAHLPMPDMGEAPKGSRGWEAQLGFSIKGISKDVKDVELQYRASSDGGKRAVSALANEVAAQDKPGLIPIIVCESRNYKHASYGKIYAPVFKIVRWVPMPKQGDDVQPKKAAGKRK